MAVIVAPWLETKPTDFTNAIKAGAQAGTELRGQDLEHQARMAAIAQQGADAQMKAQEEHERNQIASEVAKNRIALQTGNAANILQQQRQRQLAIDGGMDPIQAWLQYPGTTSGSPGAGAFQALNQQRRAALPLEQVPDPNNPGKIAGFHDGSRFYPLPQQKTAANPPMDPKEKIAIDALTKQYTGLMAKIAATPDADPSKTGMRRQALQVQQTLGKFGVPMGGPTAAPAAAPGAAAPAPGAPGQPGALQPPKVGNIHMMTNGQRFKQVGPNAADPSHWQEINPQGDTFMGTPGQPNEAELPGGMGDDPSESDTGEGGGEGDTDED